MSEGGSLFGAALKILLGVAVGVPLLMVLLQDRLMFYRQPISESRANEVARRFPNAASVDWRAADGTPLHVWQVNAGPGAPQVLYFGGNAEEVSGMLGSIGDPRTGETPGVSWLLADYRGYGRSEGSPSEGALVADAIALYDRLAGTPGFDAARTFAFGRSLGSGVAVALAAARPLAGVVLATPFDSAVAVAKHYYPVLPIDWMLRHRFDSIVHAPRLKTPLLCLIAERDEVIPPAHAERLFAAWAGPKRRVLLQGATHNNTDGAEPFWPAVRAFLARPPS